MPIKLSTSQLNLLTNIGALLSGTVIARVFSAAALIVMARMVGPEGYGRFAGSLAVLKLLAVTFSLGLDSWLLRFGSRHRQMLGMHSASSLLIKTGLGLLWLGLLTTVAFLFNQHAFPSAIVLLIALTIWFEEMTSVVWTTFNSASANRTSALLMAGYQLLPLTVIIGLAQFGVRSLAAYVGVQVVSGAIGCSLSLYWMKRVFTLQLDRSDVRKAMRDSLPFAISLALALIYGRADVAIVAYWLGSAAAGIYSPAISLVMTVLLIPLAIYNVILPLLSQAHGEDIALLRRRSRQFTFGSLLLGLGLGGGMALAAHLLIRLLFGEKFQAAGDVLFTLSGVVALRCVSFALAAIITAVGWQTRRTIVQAIVAVANVGLDILMITRWGVPGVAKIFVLTEAMLLAGYLFLVVDWYYHHTERVRVPAS